MKRWHVLVIALIACSWIGTGAFWQIRENRRNALRDAMQGRDSRGDSRGDGRGAGDLDRSQWRLASPQERGAAIAVITKQLSALKKGDFETALKLQTNELRSNFASADAFASMMKSNYSDFLSPKSIDFGRGRTPGHDGRISIRVAIITRDGASVRSVYHLLREDNELRIAGVSGGQRDSGAVLPGPGRSWPGQRSPGQPFPVQPPARAAPRIPPSGQPAPRSI